MSKFATLRKSMEKKNIPVTLSKIPEWISSGNLALNYIVSGDLRYCVPVRRSMFVSGPQGSGKSFLLGNMVKSAQDAGYHCIYIDTENSIDDQFLTRIGVNLSEEWFTPLRISTIEEAAKIYADIFKTFDNEDKIGIFCDSLSMLELESEMNKFEEGVLANDQGLLQKKMKQLVKNVNAKIGNKMMFAVWTTHVYEGQEQYGDKYRVSGGTSIQFIPSIGIMLTKSKLKENGKMSGITVNLTTYKTRYQQLGMQTSFDLPFATGMDPYDGALPFLAQEGVLEQNGAWYSYTNTDGELIKFQKNSFEEHIGFAMEAYAKLRDGVEIIEQPDDYKDEEGNE